MTAHSEKTRSVPVLTGRIALVTGGSDGIGKATAQALVRLGADVTILGRTPEKTRAAASEIGARFIVADLSDQSQVRRAATDFRATNGQLDILVNNVGAAYKKRLESVDGIEKTWALNHLAPFLLTRELEGLLHATPGARVINTTGAIHQTARIRWSDLEFHSGYRPWRAYAQSKLANLLFTRELAHRWQGLPITANAVNPGLAVGTGFGWGSDGPLPRIVGLLAPLSLTPAQGAQTGVYLATSPEVAGMSGRYFLKERERQPAPQALDDAAAARLFRLSEEQIR
jgi:retinol dehydrogenase 12